VLAIVVEAVIRIGKRSLKNRALIGLAAAAFICIFFFAVPFPIIILAAALLGFAGHFSAIAFPPLGAHAPVATNHRVDESLLGERVVEHTPPTFRRALGVSAVWLLLWLVPVAALLVTFGTQNIQPDRCFLLQDGLGDVRGSLRSARLCGPASGFNTTAGSNRAKCLTVSAWQKRRRDR